MARKEKQDSYPTISSWLLRAFLMSCLALVVVFPLFLLVTFFIWQILNFISGNLCDLFRINARGLPIILLFNFAPAVVIAIFMVYSILRLRFLIGARTVLHVKKFTETKKVVEFKADKPERIMFEYTLHHPYKNLRQALNAYPEEDFESFIKSKYPEFNLRPPWRWGASMYNFIQILTYLMSLSCKDIREFNEKFPLVEESLRITIKNLDNGKKVVRFLGPTEGYSFWAYFFYMLSFLSVSFGIRAQIRFQKEKPFYSYSNKNIKGLCNGERFEVMVQYKGTKGYSMRVFVK